MRLPKSIYEPLPAVYVLVGLSVALTHPETVPFVSGIALATGGLMILVQRREYRLRLRRRRHSTARHRPTGPLFDA